MQNNRRIAVLLRCVAIQNIIVINLEQNFAQQFLVFWLLTFKSQIFVNALLASEAAFWMQNIIALIILCSATNVALAFSKWVHDQVVELFWDCACAVTTWSNHSLIFAEKHCYHSFIRRQLEPEENKEVGCQADFVIISRKPVTPKRRTNYSFLNFSWTKLLYIIG